MKRKRVLVTGGAGFIGSHLVDGLFDEDCQVVVLVDLSSSSLKNIRSHLNSGNVRFYEGDVRCSEAVEKAVCTHCLMFLQKYFSKVSPSPAANLNFRGK